MAADAPSQTNGSFRIRTATGSLYLLDLKGRSLTRFVAAVEPTVDHLEGGMARLRRDGEALFVYGIVRLKVGMPAQFLLQVRTDDPEVRTLRTTSRVVEIVELSEDMKVGTEL